MYIKKLELLNFQVIEKFEAEFPGKVSDSQILMTATKLVVASNPNTRIFRIARGESLGAKRLAEIIEIARENHFQGFVENVVRGQEELRIEEYTEFEKKQ